MKKALRMVIPMFLVIVLLCTSILPVYAEESGISPRFVNCNTATASFNVYQNNAELTVTYTGLANTFTYARLNVQFQKKTLGLFWTDVGEEQEIKNYDTYGVFIVSQTVNGSGTYRAVFKLRVYGNLGEIDVIEDTKETVYRP